MCNSQYGECALVAYPSVAKETNTRKNNIVILLQKSINSKSKSISTNISVRFYVYTSPVCAKEIYLCSIEAEYIHIGW